MKKLFALFILFCLAGRAGAQIPECRIAELHEFDYTLDNDTAIKGASQATVFKRAKQWASKVRRANKRLFTTTDGGTLRLIVDGSWPFTYNVAGKRKTAPMHFTAELIPQDSTCSYSVSELVVFLPSHTLSAEYLTHRRSPASAQLKPELLTALRTGLAETINEVAKDLVTDLHRPVITANKRRKGALTH